MTSKRVGIIGSGQVGQTLARAFSNTGYETKIGSRTPGKLDEFIGQSMGKISSSTFEQTALFGDIVVLATLGDAAENAIQLTGKRNFSGKLVIDTTNPLDFSRGMPPGIAPRFAVKSLGEYVQEWLPDSRVIKCFNTVPNAVMFHPKFEGSDMLICGNDRNAKQEVTEILKQFGWAGSIDLGGIENAKWLEALVPLWVRAAIVSSNWVSMFKFVK